MGDRKWLNSHFTQKFPEKIWKTFRPTLSLLSIINHMKITRRQLKALIVESYIEDYAKHSTMNLGQVLRHLRYLTDLPDTPRLEALKQRLRWIANDLYYTVTPGQWHHTQAELDELSKYTYADLLKMGFDPDFADEMLGED